MSMVMGMTRSVPQNLDFSRDQHLSAAAGTWIAAVPRRNPMRRTPASRTSERHRRRFGVAGVLRRHDVEEALALRACDGLRRDREAAVGPARYVGLVPARVASELEA